MYSLTTKVTCESMSDLRLVFITSDVQVYQMCQMISLQSKMSPIHRKYWGYVHKTNTVVFTILPVNKRPISCVSSRIIGKVSLFGYVVYSQIANLSSNGGKEIEYGLVNGRLNDKYNSVGFVEISVCDALLIFLWNDTFDRLSTSEPVAADWNMRRLF